MTTDSIAARLAAIRAAITRAEKDFGRTAESATLVAVSKTFGAEVIVEALSAGQRVFGENYIQESKAKWPALKERFPDAVLHFIGPLQSNKAEDAVRLFDVIESLDRESLARELAKQIDRAGRRPRLIVQVNTGDEPQKGGVSPRTLDAFLALCRKTYGLEISGLMCIPPADQPPSPHFAMLAKLARENGLSTLSMGMSADYEAAIQLGATHVRVGSAIFGARG
jgi:PLP dependent protein